MEVRELMTEKPESVEKDVAVRDVVQRMLDFDIRHMPVLESGRLVGIVSDRDIRDFSFPVGDGDYLERSNPRVSLDGPISAIMSTGVFSVFPETSLEDVIEVMVDEKFTAIPVVESAGEQLVGIVSYIDVLKVFKKNLAE